MIDDTLLIRYFSDELTSEERLAVDKWLDESEENQRIAERIYYIKYAGDTIQTIRTTDVRADLRKVWKKIHSRRPRLWVMWARAAAIACLFVIPAFLYLQFKDKHSELIAMTIDVPEGSVSSMVLPDGSKLWLNAGSRLSYGNKYGISDRKIQMSGEAFFDVQTNTRLPFEVEANGIVVCAKGTQFNVKAYPDEPTVTAVLTEGVIEITSPDGLNQRAITLQPGQMAVYNRADRKLAVKAIEKPGLFSSWKEQTWLIEGATLGELAPMLQRRYAVKVVFDNEILKNYKFRGELSNRTAEQVARALHLTAPMNYRITNDTVFFTIDLKRKKEFDQYVK